MPRRARIDAAGAVHHVIVRGIERRVVFRDDPDRDDFIKRLGHIVSETHTRCFAWALMPNHFHLLMKTGSVPLATVMRRLLTGHAIYFNRKHRRSGHLFQNLYKSILCQEDVYLKELVRYIHLNPLRAKLVKDIAELDRYSYCGHGYIMGKHRNEWQAMDEVLGIFGESASRARNRYRAFVSNGIELGKQPSLTGGGLIRSAGGWTAIQSMRKGGFYQKSDERILGDGDFVEEVLSAAGETMKTRYSLATKGICFADIVRSISDRLGIDPEEITGASKERKHVKARNLICHFAVQDLGMAVTEIANQLIIAVSTASAAAQRGRKTAKEEGLKLFELLNM